MKKTFVKLLPLFLIFIMSFSMVVSAETGRTYFPECASTSHYPFSSLIGDDISYFHWYVQEYYALNTEYSVSNMDVMVFCTSSNKVLYVYLPDSYSYSVVDFNNDSGWFKINSNSTIHNEFVIVYCDFSVTESDSAYGSARDYFWKVSQADYFELINYELCYTFGDVYGSSSYADSLFFTTEIVEPSVPSYSPKNDLGELEDSNMQFNESVQNETLADSDLTSNSNVFLRIFQSMTGMLNNVGQAVNSIAHYASEISGKITEYATNIVQNGFEGVNQLLNDILSAIKDIAVAALPENLISMIDDLYSSGLDSNGEFGLDNMFSYWLVPSDEFIDSQYDKLVGALPFIEEIQGISDTLLNLFQTVEPKSPTITIHAGTYGFIVLTDDCVIDFDWFLDWKPYTDIFIAVFVYAGLALHLVRQLPGILGGTSSVVNSASGLDKPQKGGKGS